MRTSTVDRVIAEIIARQERGEHVDPNQWIADYPDIAKSLADYFAGANLLQQVIGEPTNESESTKPSKQSPQTRAEAVPAAESGLPDEFLSGERDFGRYRIRRLLGQGGMGAVYLALDRVLKRDVAVKVPIFSAEERTSQLERFRREAMTAAKLHHRNICPVFDVGQFEGTDYLTMAFIEGRVLSEFAASPRHLDQRKVVTTVYKLALAIRETHAMGIVHRDLKPSNVMIDQVGEPVLMDFGLAKHLDLPTHSRLTRTGIAVGTPAYMSPEQIRGIAEEIGPQTDIYSLGVILFELLTGKLPYGGNALEIMGRKLVGPVDHARNFRPDIDEELERICDRMMARDLDDRYRTMDEVARDLKEVALRLRSRATAPNSVDEHPTKATGLVAETIIHADASGTTVPSEFVTSPVGKPIAPPVVLAEASDSRSRSITPAPVHIGSHSIHQLRLRFAHWQTPVLFSSTLLVAGLTYLAATAMRNADRPVAAERVEIHEPEISLVPNPSTEQIDDEPDAMSEPEPANESVQSDSEESSTEPSARVVEHASQICDAIKLINLRTTADEFETGDRIPIAFDLLFDSEKPLTVPADGTSSDAPVPLGIGNVWIERQGAVGEIPALTDRQHVEFLYPIGSWDTTMSPSMSPFKVIPRQCEIATTEFPAGRYNLYLEYADLQADRLQMATTSFTLIESKTRVGSRDESAPFEVDPTNEIAKGDGDMAGRPPATPEEAEHNDAPAADWLKGRVGGMLHGHDQADAPVPANPIRPWESAPVVTRGFSVVPNMQSLSNKLDHVARLMGYTPPRVLDAAASAARFEAGLDRTGPLICLYGPPPRGTSESPLAFLIPTTDFDSLIRNLNPRGGKKVWYVSDGHQNFQCIESQNHACFSLVGERGWLERCARQPGGLKPKFQDLNPFLDRLDIAFAISKQAVTEKLAIQLPFANGPSVIPDGMDEIAESIFAFSGFEVAAGGTRIKPGEGVSVAAAATIDTNRDVGRWSNSMTYSRDELLQTLPHNDAAVVLAMSSCHEWNEWLEELLREQLKIAGAADNDFLDRIEIDSLRGAAMMLTGRAGLPPDQIAEQVHFQIHLHNAIDSIHPIGAFLQAIQPLIQVHPSYRLAIETTKFRQKPALIATIRVDPQNKTPTEYQASIWPLDEETLVVQGGDLSALDDVVRRIRSGERFLQDVAVRNSLQLTDPGSQHLLLFDAYHSAELVRQVFLATGKGLFIDRTRLFPELKEAPPLVVAGQFQPSLIELRVTASDTLLQRLSSTIGIEVIGIGFTNLAQGRPFASANVVNAIVRKHTQKQAVGSTDRPRVSPTPAVPVELQSPELSAIFYALKLLAF